MSATTIKTNEKTRLIIIDKEGIELYCKEYLLAEFNQKWRHFNSLKCLGELRHDFQKLLPILNRAKLKRVPKNTLIIK
jgi:predicted nucleic acid-binding protein